MDTPQLFLDAIAATFDSQTVDKIDPVMSNQIGQTMGLTPFQTLETLITLASNGKIVLDNGYVLPATSSPRKSDQSAGIHLGAGATMITAPVSDAVVNSTVQGSAVGNNASNEFQSPPAPVGELISLITALRTASPALPESDRAVAKSLSKDAQDALDSLNNNTATDENRKKTLTKLNDSLEQLTKTDKHIRTLMPTIKLTAAKVSEWLSNAGWVS